MERASAVRCISKLLDTQCSGCQKRDELIKQYGSTFSRIDGYCNKNCPIGQDLQSLGGLLRRDYTAKTHLRSRSESQASGCSNSVGSSVAIVGNVAPQVSGVG
ncbi:zinc-finger domain-containing protein [Paenibacillus paeoniae]|uniref:Zinc-finger domain-containing protein n=1 Tax=Paenibacillus paeoniae TaxID=2292705 RepID=A0A371P072_9BACL|nr:zinc-finger domain-containing protein [Paenibacillus paeoniae]